MEIKKQLRTELIGALACFAGTAPSEAAGGLPSALAMGPGPEAAAIDLAIIGHILDSEIYRSAGTVFAYVGVGAEIATMPLISSAIADGKAVCCPLTLGGGVMEARRILSAGDLRAGRKNLLEPESACELVPPEAIGLAIVPCLSCDPYGNRIGYGGGYYDRYLKRLQKTAVTAAVCREALLSQHLPRRPNDVRVSHVVTESGVFSSISYGI